MAGPVIVYFSPWNYWERENRRQPLARALAKRGHLVLYVNYPLGDGRRQRLRTRLLHRRVEKVQEGLYITRGGPLRQMYFWRDMLFVASTGGTVKQYAFVDHVARLLRRAPFRGREVVVLSSRMISELFVERVKARLHALDIEDPWSRFDGIWGVPREALLPALARFSRKADVAVANGIRVAEVSRAEFHHREIAVLPNGVDVERFRPRPERGRPADYPEGPSVLFSGTVDRRIDFELLEPSFVRFPGVNFVFVGMVAPPFVPQVELMKRRHRNVWFLGHRSIEALPAYLQQADLFMIPYRRDDTWTQVFPAKVYEYFLCGRETVSSFPMADVAPELQFAIKVAATAERFAACVEEGVRGSARGGEIAAHGRRQDWSERAARLEQYLGLELARPTDAIAPESLRQATTRQPSRKC